MVGCAAPSPRWQAWVVVVGVSWGCLEHATSFVAETARGGGRFNWRAVPAWRRSKVILSNGDEGHVPFEPYSARYVEDNGLIVFTDEDGRVRVRAASEEDKDRVSSQRQRTAEEESDSEAFEAIDTVANEEAAAIPEKHHTTTQRKRRRAVQEHPVAAIAPASPFNVVLTHCQADFDSLASAVGLARLWSSEHSDAAANTTGWTSHSAVPTFVVLPRGAHPGVQKFLALHKHLFPIRSLRSLPSDLSALNRLGLVDAQRRDRIGPAEHLLGYANSITIVDHHIDGESDIPEATDYVLDAVGSVSTLVTEQLRDAQLEISEAEATLLALGIHADTGSLCYDSTTPRDATALAWTMSQGASQTAISEHAKSSLSPEQQGVLTQTLLNINSTFVHGVTVSTALLSADGFVNGLASVATDALELSSSDLFLLAVVYDPKTARKKKKNTSDDRSTRWDSRFLKLGSRPNENNNAPEVIESPVIMETEAWTGGEDALRRRRLRAAFDRRDTDESGYLEKDEIAAVLAASGVIATEESVQALMESIDTDGDGRVDFEEFVKFAADAEERQKEQDRLTGRRPATMIIIGRVKAGMNMKEVNLNDLFQQFGGGGHSKAASATVRLDDESEAGAILQGLVDELIEKSFETQLTVGDFMQAPVLSAKPTMTEKHVEDLFLRYDLRALPVVDDDDNVIGLVTYKEVAAAKQRLWNKEQKRRRQQSEGNVDNKRGGDANEERKLGSAVKGWMKQHVQVVEASTTMSEVEAILLETDVGCIPVVEDGTKKLVGIVTRTDLLRQHRYYPSLHYHNKAFADSIAARNPELIKLRKKLKKFDVD